MPACGVAQLALELHARSILEPGLGHSRPGEPGESEGVTLIGATPTAGGQRVLQWARAGEKTLIAAKGSGRIWKAA
jgi:hypothetical protein